MRTDVSNSRVGAVLRACPVSLALGLAALLGAFLMAAQPSAAVGARFIAPMPVGNPPHHTSMTTLTFSPGWSALSSSNTGSAKDFLTAVAAISADDVWAVGYHGTEWNLIKHWDGSSWSVVDSPSPNAYGSQLYGVAAVATNDVWAVGSESGRTYTLIVHWNGSYWSVVDSPNPCPNSLCINDLSGVAAVSANDVWAVGAYINQRTDRPEALVVHWNGSYWLTVPSPSPGMDRDFSLSAVAAVSANDVWAVGGYEGGTLVEHWDGSSWSVVPSPNVGLSSDLRSIAAVSANDVWAVGVYSDSSSDPYQTLVEHWDGSSWSVVPSPNAGLSSDLKSIAAVSANDVWAVGSYSNNNGDSQTLVEHWDGSSWSVVPSPNASASDNYLYGAAALPATDVWAVGGFLTLHWDGSNWNLTSNPAGGTGSGHSNAVAAL